MPVKPTRFQDLVTQVTAHLRKHILEGQWQDWLPGERQLALELQVSRKTVRRSLALLKKERFLKTVSARGHRVLGETARPRQNSRPTLPVTVLIPEALENLRPFTALWIGRLQGMLHDNGIGLRWVAAPKGYSLRPGRALERIVAQYPSSCWILTHSDALMQRWFMSEQRPCIISGSTHPGIDLPNLDLDHQAMCRHAAGVFLRAGHDRVAFLLENRDRAGEIESEQGFLDGMRSSRRPLVTPMIARHDKTIASVTAALERLLRLPQRPTALFIAQSTVYLSVLGVLARHRLRVPEDISTICRDDDPVFKHLVPIPARYSCPPEKFARQMARAVKQIISGEKLANARMRITPTYVAAGSLSPRETRNETASGTDAVKSS